MIKILFYFFFLKSFFEIKIWTHLKKNSFNNFRKSIFLYFFFIFFLKKLERFMSPAHAPCFFSKIFKLFFILLFLFLSPLPFLSSFLFFFPFLSHGFTCPSRLLLPFSLFSFSFFLSSLWFSRTTSSPFLPSPFFFTLNEPREREPACERWVFGRGWCDYWRCGG